MVSFWMAKECAFRDIEREVIKASQARVGQGVLCKLDDALSRVLGKFCRVHGKHLGIRNRTEEHIVGSCHNLVYARTIRRRRDPEKCEVEKLESINVGPLQAEILQERKKKARRWSRWNMNPKVGPFGKAKHRESKLLPSESDTMREHIRKAGVTEGCPGCEAAVGGGKMGAHWQSCRARLEEAMEVTAKP